MKSEWEEEGEDRFEVGENREKRKGDKFKEGRKKKKKKGKTEEDKLG